MVGGPTMNKPTAREILDALVNIWDGMEPDAPEEIDEFLREAGYDPDELGRKLERVAREAMYKWHMTGNRKS
jgi:hypothetical protein